MIGQNSYSAIKETDYAPDCVTDDSDCTTEKCSLEVYVVWSGTDKRGNYLLSQQKRLSNFQSGQVDT